MRHSKKEAEDRRGTDDLLLAVEDIADQMGRAVGGDLEFTVRVPSDAYALQKFGVMVNFLLERVRRLLAEQAEQAQALRRAHDALAEASLATVRERDRLGQVVTHLGAALCLVDDTGQVLWANEQAKAWLLLRERERERTLC